MWELGMQDSDDAVIAPMVDFVAQESLGLKC